MCTQIQQVCAIISGLVVSYNYDVAKRALCERSFEDNAHFFRSVFEIGRRYKVLNPDKMRGTYGKFVHMLQDSVKEEVIGLLNGMECVGSMKTVWSLLSGRDNGNAFLEDPLLDLATREIYSEGRTREEVDAEVKKKQAALSTLKSKYAKPPEPGKPAEVASTLGSFLKGEKARSSGPLSESEVELCVKSLSDHLAFQRFNREPVDRMIGLLKSFFSPTSAEDALSNLELSRGRGGSKLSHNHRTQFTFVHQSLLLWREIMGNMYTLWRCTEEDFLDPSLRYRLCDTGQGLNRLQSAPRVSRIMHQILHGVQSECQGWVGLSVVHLGDRDVPNALVFIDKYTQVPRILTPIMNTIDRLPELYESTDAMANLIDKQFGGLEKARKLILGDFFRHGFDGSGDDGGSCVDGRLTSCWNWCSKIEKKSYYPLFLLTGFTGFDGNFGE